MTTAFRPDPKKVSDKEIVGRRIFSKSDSLRSSTDAKDAAVNFRHTHFLDTRLNTDLSFDRLGIREPCTRALEHLRPLGRKMGNARNMPFRGWAVIQMRHLNRHQVTPTAAEGEDNVYHCELSRDKYRDQTVAEILAVALATYASRNPFIADSDPSDDEINR